MRLRPCLRLAPWLALLAKPVSAQDTPASATSTPAATSAPAATASAPTPATSPPAPATAQAPACFPACREGYTCHQQQCISLCNPPCPSGLECVEGRRCEPPLPGHTADRPYEPPPPKTKEFEERTHALLAFHWGLPGNYELDGAEGDLGPTLGFNLRGDSPIAKYVLIGPMLQMGSWAPDVEPAPDHNYYVDLDLVLRLRAPITTSSLNYQLWVGMPVGVSLDLFGGDDDRVGLGFGWNIGVLFGGAVHFNSKFGLFTELGWLQHKFAHEVEGAADLDFKLQQTCLNLGIIVRN